MTDSALTMQADNALAAGTKAPRVGKHLDLEQAKKTAQNFEAYFLGQMFQPAFADLGADGPFGGGYGEKMWQSMLVEQYGKQMARSGGVGIADAVLRQILSTQEVH